MLKVAECKSGFTEAHMVELSTVNQISKNNFLVASKVWSMILISDTKHVHTYQGLIGTVQGRPVKVW